MNRRAFLQAALSLIPAPLLARLPIPPALPIADAVTPKRAVWTTPDTWAHRELITAERLNDMAHDTRVDYFPIDETDVTYTSTGLFVRILVTGETTLSHKCRSQFDLLVDGVRQRKPLDLWSDDYITQQFAFVFETLPTRGTHTYGIVQRVSNGTATTTARLYVSEVW